MKVKEDLLEETGIELRPERDSEEIKQQFESYVRGGRKSRREIAEREKQKKLSGFKKIYGWLLLPLTVFYYEIVTQFHCFGKLTFPGVLYMFFFALALGIVLTTVSFMVRGKARTVVTIVLLSLLTLLFGIQAVYNTIFHTFTTLNSVANGAGDAVTNYWRETISGIWKSLPTVLLLLIPLVFYCLLGRKLTQGDNMSWQIGLLFIGLALVLQLITGGLVRLNTAGTMSYRAVYCEMFNPDLSVPRFGIVTTLRLDIQKSLFGLSKPKRPKKKAVTVPSVEVSTSPSVEPSASVPSAEPSVEPIVYKDRVLEIDFDALMANETDDSILEMHEYFASQTPTKENEYTGMFKDCNLIWLCCEGFSSWALDETHTPTLYKMAHEGFVFNNFYNPVWGVSTSDGEYVDTTGLIPEDGVWSYYRSSDNYMPFGFGNIFNALGVHSRAYHNHDWDYYDRDLSHPNMGYDYKGVGHGLDVEYTWPESDVEMMEKTVDEYIHDQRFMTYYMTVSGHLEYNFMGNYMSYKHMEEVEDLPYSEACRAYIACQMELDQAIEYLITRLRAAGKLDNTVFVLSGDHYPYGLEMDEIEELNGGTVEENFELYRSTLIIWNSKMKTVKVDKYCSSLDIMPTLANLFDLPVDSRLVMGRDILSDAPALVMFKNRSFITDCGRYDSTTDTFYPNEGVEVPEDYCSEMYRAVDDKFYYSAQILEQDYYRIILGD